jgi:hypothetical protein
LLRLLRRPKQRWTRLLSLLLLALTVPQLRHPQTSSITPRRPTHPVVPISQNVQSAFTLSSRAGKRRWKDQRMERVLSELVSVALSAVRDRKSKTSQIKSPHGRTHTMSWTHVNAVLGLTFRLANILLSQMPGPSNPESTDKETFADKNEC